MVEVALGEQAVDELDVLGELLLVGLEDDLELLPADPPVVVEVEVLEGEEQVVAAVRGRLREAGRDELVVGELAVVVDVHAPDDLADVPELLPALLRGHVARELLHGQEAVLVAVDLEEDLAEQHDVLLRELRGDVVEHQHLELSGPTSTFENFE